MLHHLRNGLLMYFLHIFRQQFSFFFDMYIENLFFNWLMNVHLHVFPNCMILKRKLLQMGVGGVGGWDFIFYFILFQSSSTTGQDGECEFPDSPAPLQRHQGTAPLRTRAVRLLPPVCRRGGDPREPDSHTSAVHQVRVGDGSSF